MYAYLDLITRLFYYHVANYEIYDIISPFTVLNTVLPCKPMAKNNNFIFMQIINISPTSFFLLFGYVVWNGLKMILQQKSFLLQFYLGQAIIFPRLTGL